MINRQPLTPHAYQEKAAIDIAVKRRVAIFAEPGLGKTIIALRAIQIVRPARALIVAPKQIAFNTWPDEITRWDLFDDLSYTIVHADKSFDPSAQIWIVNPEGLKKVAKTKFDFLVLDESTLFKSAKSQRYKRALQLAMRAKYCVALTGNPIPRDYMDLWSQMRLVDLGETLYKFIGQYRTRYFNAIPKRISADLMVDTYEIKPGADKMIQSAIKPRARVIRAAGLIEVPPLVIDDRRVELDRTAAAFYRDFERDLFAEIKGAELLTFSAGAKYSKLCQIANGAVYDDDQQTIPVHVAKIDALRALIDEMDGAPLLVAYRYRHDRDRILAAFPSARAHTDGAIEKWNAGQIPIYLAQYRAMSRGVNLQHGGRHMCCFSLTDNFDDYYQMVCRLYRQGAPGKTFIHRIIARDTVDEMQLVRLQRRQSNMVDLLTSLRAYKQLRRLQ